MKSGWSGMASGVLFLLSVGCATSLEEQQYHQNIQQFRKAYERGELSEEGFRQAVRELDYLRPSRSEYVRPP